MGLLEILFRDEHLVCINKPDGLIVHLARRSHDHVAALQLLRDQVGRFVYPVHRLDRPTSGALLFALDSATAALMREQFDAHTIRKTYVAVVRGALHDEGVVDYPLRDEDDSQVREARTRYRCLAHVTLPDDLGPKTRPHYSLATVWPETGRTHQIRRHLRHIRHPILGDTTHGDTTHNRFFQERFGSYRLLLHAECIEFTHPQTGQPMVVHAPLPPEMTTLFARLGWSYP